MPTQERSTFLQNNFELSGHTYFNSISQNSRQIGALQICLFRCRHAPGLAYHRDIFITVREVCQPRFSLFFFRLPDKPSLRALDWKSQSLSFNHHHLPCSKSRFVLSEVSSHLHPKRMLEHVDVRSRFLEMGSFTWLLNAFHIQIIIEENEIFYQW